MSTDDADSDSSDSILHSPPAGRSHYSRVFAKSDAKLNTSGDLDGDSTEDAKILKEVAALYRDLQKSRRHDDMGAVDDDESSDSPVVRRRKGDLSADPLDDLSGSDEDGCSFCGAPDHTGAECDTWNVDDSGVHVDV
jgi:hypothetical protein